MIEFQFFPLIGLVIGADYINSDLEQEYNTSLKKHSLTIYLFLFGVSINWYKDED